MKHAYRAALLRFDAQGQALYEADGLLVAERGRVVAAGDYRALSASIGDTPVTHWPGHMIAPGFIDTHVHYAQTDVIGSRADGLLPWLENHTFPHEARFADEAYAAEVARFFFDELKRHGVTTASVFCTSHAQSVDAFMREAHSRGLRMIAGKCLMDSHAPDGVRDATEQSLRDTESLIARWHGVGRLGYAITPRFAASCSEAQLAGAGELARAHPSVWVQSHVSENLDEIAWIAQLFPRDASYLSVYDRLGLLSARSIYAHCIHFTDSDRALMRERGALAAVCPTSNAFLGSGNFDFAAAADQRMLHALASDIGGGMSFSPFATMRAAYTAARSDSRIGADAVTGLALHKRGLSMSAAKLWWLHTAAAAQGLGLGDEVGSLRVGQEADFIVLNPQATPMLQRKASNARDLDELLFAYVMLGDDRAVAHTHVASA
jgi:guanine deaminase